MECVQTEYEGLKNERHSASVKEAKELGGEQIKLVSGLLSVSFDVKLKRNFSVQSICHTYFYNRRLEDGLTA